MKHSRRVGIIIGLILLLSGISVVFLTLTNVIPNKEHRYVNWFDPYTLAHITETVQLQPKECLLFEGVFDSGDKVQLNIRIVRGVPSGDLATGTEKTKLFNLTLDIKNSENTVLRHSEYDYQYLQDLPWDSFYPIDIFFEVPEYDTYSIFVEHTSWMGIRPMRPSYEPQEEWSFYDIGTSPIGLPLKADFEIQKSTPSLTFMVLGLVLLSAGVVLTSISFLKKT
jgi:hypothetical protein